MDKTPAPTNGGLMAAERRRTHELLLRLQLLFLRRLVPNQCSTFSLPRFGRWVSCTDWVQPTNLTECVIGQFRSWHIPSIRGNATLRSLSERSGYRLSQAYRKRIMSTRP